MGFDSKVIRIVKLWQLQSVIVNISSKNMCTNDLSYCLCESVDWLTFDGNTRGLARWLVHTEDQIEEENEEYWGKMGENNTRMRKMRNSSSSFSCPPEVESLATPLSIHVLFPVLFMPLHYCSSSEFIIDWAQAISIQLKWYKRCTGRAFQTGTRHLQNSVSDFANINYAN